jgi:predicted metal-dependent hydrolase
VYLEKADLWWFAHFLSCRQIKLPMNKRERISQWLAGSTGEALVPDDENLATHPYYHAFFHCWNEQRYYEAHDVLEQLWLNNDSGDAVFFKGLIQAAGAFVHLQKHFQYPLHAKHSKRLAPAVRLFRLAEKNLAKFGPWHYGLEVAALSQLMRAYVDNIVASDYKTNPWSPQTAPKLQVGTVHPNRSGD